MPKNLLADQPYKEVINALEQAFLLRRSDAMPRSLKQIKEWQAARRGAILRNDKHSSRQLRGKYRHVQTLVQKNIGRYTPKDGVNGATPELLAKPSLRDSIRALEDAGSISGEQAAAAREIQRIVEIITSLCHPKCQTYQKGAEGFRPGGFLPSETAFRWSQVYVPWHRAMNARADKRLASIALWVIIDGIALDKARRRARMSYERGHQYLTQALDLYVELKETVNDRKDRELAIIEAEARA